jgi:lysophospholipase L1-like esterase
VEVVAPPTVGMIVAAGDSITDGTNSTMDTNNRWPDIFAQRLAAQKGMRRFAIANAAIAGNRVISDVAGDFGANIQSRFDRDVLAESGATHVVFMEGINDIGGAQAEPVAERRRHHCRSSSGHRARPRTRTEDLRRDAHADRRHFYYTAVGEAKRTKVNEWIRTSGEYDGVIDFDAAIATRNVRPHAAEVRVARSPASRRCRIQGDG